ncbi:MAG: hypothetical protein R3C11_01460 [Planctomycetaceae bacterium]
MTTTSEKKTILFIGAQQAGKTTLMCGWYHLARQAYNATPVQEFGQTVDLLETYQRYQDVTVVDPTSRGEVTRAQFQCEHKHQKFLLELIDYAGEDLICSASKFLHGAIDESPHSELEQGFLADVTRADWIIMVHDPIAISDGTAAQLIDALWLSKVLPRILFDGQPGDVSNATLYLSRGDSISPELVANAVKSLKDCLKKNSLADLEIRCGDARVWNDTMDRKPQREFQQLFTQTMLTILDQSGSEITRIRSQATEKNSTKWWWILAIAMVLVVILGVLSQEDKSNASANAVEEIHLELDQIEDESKGNITDTKAQELLSTLESLEMRVANEVPVDSEYNEEFKEVVSVLRSVLSSIDPPRSPDSNNGIAYEIGELIKVHGPNLRAFYDDLAKTAEFAHSDDNTWDQASRKRWTQILQFCETVKDGVDIELDHSSFKGPQWWTGYIGSSYLRMEIWEYQSW